MSIHATFEGTVSRISHGASDICIRLFLGMLLVFAFWTWFPNTGAAGEWFGPCPNSVTITKAGNTHTAGAALADQRVKCYFPDSAGIVGHTVLPVSVTAHTFPNNAGCVLLPNGTFTCSAQVLYRCTGHDLPVSTGHCALQENLAIDNGCSAAAGNPVEIATGRKVETTVDWTSGGTSPLILSRKYSSLYFMGGAPAYSRLGMGWHSNFDAGANYLFSTGVSNPTQAQSGDRVHIVLPNSNEYSFRLNGGVWKHTLPRPHPTLAGFVYWDQYRTDLDVALTLTTEFVELRIASGERYVFDLEGRLVKIEFPNGYSQFLAYSGKINTKVTDSFGRTLSFEYWSEATKAGLLKAVTTSDGKRFLFDYIDPIISNGSTGDTVSLIDYSTLELASVVYPDNTPATDSDNPKITYGYLQSLEYPYALTGIYDERGIKVSSWTYDNKGRATSS